VIAEPTVAIAAPLARRNRFTVRSPAPRGGNASHGSAADDSAPAAAFAARFVEPVKPAGGAWHNFTPNNTSSCGDDAAHTGPIASRETNP
jgi:hypothetical protein